MAEARLIYKVLVDSDRFNKLTWMQQVFYMRLLLFTDDYGLFDARPSWMRSNLYPTLDTVSQRDAEGMLKKCEQAGLVKLYSVDGKEYGQVTRCPHKTQTSPKYPLPEWLEVFQENKKYTAIYKDIHTESKRVTVTQCESKQVTVTQTESASNRIESNRIEYNNIDKENAGDQLAERAMQPDDFTPSLKSCAASAEDVERYLAGLPSCMLPRDQLPRCAENFFCEMAGSGWLNRYGRPYTDWRPIARKFAANWTDYRPNNRSGGAQKNKKTGDLNH